MSSSSRSSSPMSPPTTRRHSPIAGPRKRRRTDQEVEDLLMGPSRTSALVFKPVQEEVARDDQFYFSDGNCILRVQHTLFNVHRTMLCKDSSMFSTMFSLPQGEGETDGRSDECPIHLHGDTVAQFKSFLWVLYALPHELAEVTGAQIDQTGLNRLIDIAQVSFKYHFKSLETWALDVINVHINRKPSPIFAIPTPGLQIPSYTAAALTTEAAINSNGALVSRLMRLAQLCDHERLLNTVIIVLRQLMSFSIRYSHLAMTLADELDLRPLRGIAYFDIMQKAQVVTRDEADSDPESEYDEHTIVDHEGRLIVSHQQKIRLLMGYYKLTHLWERLRATPLSFDHAAACGATWHQHGCTQCWLDFWKEKTKSDAVLALGLADVLGRLKAIVKEFARWGSATYMHQDCRATVKKAMQDKIKQIEDALPNYFVDEMR